MNITQADYGNYRVHPFLPVYLRLLAAILFIYWGLSHLVHPEWYLVSMMSIVQFDPGNGYDLWSAYLMGVLNAAIAVTIWRAAKDPVRNLIVIDMIFLVSVGTILVFIIGISQLGISSREILNIFLIAASLIVLGFLYPVRVKK